MSNKKKDQKNNEPSSAPRTATVAAAPKKPEPLPMLPAMFWGGVLLLLVAIGATGTLVYSYLTGMAAPGCGPGSDCAAAANSVWGKVPGIGWPVSALGFTFFVSLLIGWIGSARGIANGFIWLIRLGVVASLFYLGVIIFGGYTCRYCLAAHIANIAFWILAESARSSIGAPSLPALARFSAAFAMTTIVVAGVDYWQKRSVHEQKEADLAESTKQLVEQTKARQTNTPPSTTSTANTNNTITNATAASNVNASGRPVHSPPGGFTGRWRLGPENAAIRIVVFSDYQCPDCRDMERQIMQVFASRDDVSVSHKHNPMCNTCNKYLGMACLHQNACWAARAAEAAGIVGGNDAFWKVHKWLFENEGFFETPNDLRVGLNAIGFDSEQQKQFFAVLETDETLDRVKSDIEEARILGLYFTPMVFINGVELRGFVKNPTALPRAVAQLVAADPQPGSPAQDQPPLAIEKCVGDWKAQHVVNVPPQLPGWPIGPEDAPIKVVVWYDAQFPGTLELHEFIKKQMEERGDIQYTYRNYPQDKRCNPHARTPRQTAACWVAAASLAAAQLGGSDAFWKVNEWMMRNNKSLDDESLRAAAPELGLDGDKLIDAINSAVIRQDVASHVQTTTPIIRQGVPTIYVNGKWVSRWKFDNEIVLDDVFNEIAKR